MRITGYNAAYTFIDGDGDTAICRIAFSASKYVYEAAESLALLMVPLLQAMSDSPIISLTISKVYGLTPNMVPAYTSDITRLGVIVISLENGDYTWIGVPSVKMDKVIKDVSGKYTYVLSGADYDVLNLNSLMGIICDELGELSQSIVIAGVAQ